MTMPLRLYNTRTRQVETFAPLQPGRVRVYVCGLTPSAEAHLGHARSFLIFDVLRRYLGHLGMDVTYVQNVTDIDDRSINRAKETGEDWRRIVRGYYDSFKTSMRKLGVREPDEEPFATHYIAQILTMIEELVALGYAYASTDGVYYRVSRFPSYGALSNRNVDELLSGSRVEIDEAKDDPLDFALWKFAKPGEPAWESPWGAGRPGWHIECSAMSRALLDPQGGGFDIHGGGADLIFPHHENEIAQSEPLMPHPPMATVWVHGGLLLFDNRKMSKSLGNFEPLTQLLERHDPQAVRLLFLQTGYSKVMNFTEESIASATALLRRVQGDWRNRNPSGELDVPVRNPGGALVAALEKALNNDLNTSAALAAVVADRTASGPELTYALTLLGLQPNEAWLAQGERELPADFIERLRAAVAADVSLDGVRNPRDAIALVLDRRDRARTGKDWAASDRLRDALAACGVVLKDSKDGTTWNIGE